MLKKMVVFKATQSCINSEESEFLLNICMDVNYYVIQSLFLLLPFLPTGLKQAKHSRHSKPVLFHFFFKERSNFLLLWQKLTIFVKRVKKFTDYHLSYNFPDSLGRYLVNGCTAFRRMNYFFSRRHKHKLKHTFKKSKRSLIVITYHLTLIRLTWLTSPTKVQTILINNTHPRTVSFNITWQKKNHQNIQ